MENLEIRQPSFLGLCIKYNKIDKNRLRIGPILIIHGRVMSFSNELLCLFWLFRDPF